MLRRRIAIGLSLILLVSVATSACGLKTAGKLTGETPADYVWVKVTDHAAFPESYNFPMFNVSNQLWVFHPEGNWFSADGRSWTKAELPALGLRTRVSAIHSLQRCDLCAGHNGRQLSEFESRVGHDEDQ